MIDYGRFAYAAAPRTGTTFFLKACWIAGFGEGTKVRVHEPPRTDWNGFILTTVRHPYYWLMSFYNTIAGGKIGIEAVDRFSDISRQSKDASHFIRRCADDPGCVGRMFDTYRASSVLKVEDMPWAAIETFTLCKKVSNEAVEEIRHMGPQNRGFYQHPNSSQELKELIVESEKDFCERYEYY